VLLAVTLSDQDSIRSDEPAPPGGRKKRGFAVQKSVHRIFGRTRATMLGAALLSGAALPAAGLWAGSALALPINPVCTTTTLGLTTCTFSSTHAATTWPVPAGITHLTVIAEGGSGANADAATTWHFGGGTGGPGGDYKATLTNIPAGTALSIFPGSAGNGSHGGTDVGSGGGNSTTDTYGYGGGGGGATTVTIAHHTTHNLLVVAGGGGGAGGENQSAIVLSNGGNGGGSGGVNGVDGTPAAPYFTNGGGGKTIPLGTGGTAGAHLSCTKAASPGTLLDGGNSNNVACTFAGGGGGDGYYGGGGSDSGAGAGGGSAYPAGVNTVRGITVTPDTSEHATHTGDGKVIITFQKVPTRIRPNIFFNNHQTFTVTGTLTSFGSPVAGQLVRVSTGPLHLHSCITGSNGVAHCVLTYAESIAIRNNAGRYTVTFPGSNGYLPSSASGQAIIHP
jgi:Glycine rich protein